MDDTMMEKYGRLLDALADGALLTLNGEPCRGNAAAKGLFGDDFSQIPESVQSLLQEESGILSCTGLFRRGGIEYDLTCTPVGPYQLLLMRPRNQAPMGDPEGLPLPASGLGGEYSQILSEILLATQLLDARLGRGPEAPKCRDTLASVGRGCCRLMRLSQNLTLFSQLRHGQLPRPERMGDFTEFFRQLAEEVAAYVSETGRTLKVAVPEKSVVTCFDAQLCRTLIYQLLSNALRASAPEGEISLRMTCGEGRIYLHVEDTGTGIPERQLPYLFESYARRERDLRREEGFGLGLALCKEIAVLHGGSVALWSKEGKGTRVTVSLPVVLAAGGGLGDVRLPLPGEGFDRGMIELSDVLPPEVYR